MSENRSPNDQVATEEPIAVEKGKADNQQMEELTKGEYVSAKQVAQHFGYTRAYVTALLALEKIRGVKPIGGQWRIPISEYERMKREGMPPLPREPKKPPVTEIMVDPERTGIETPERKAEASPEGKERFNPFGFLFK